MSQFDMRKVLLIAAIALCPVVGHCSTVSNSSRLSGPGSGPNLEVNFDAAAVPQWNMRTSGRRQGRAAVPGLMNGMFHRLSKSLSSMLKHSSNMVQNLVQPASLPPPLPPPFHQKTRPQIQYGSWKPYYSEDSRKQSHKLWPAIHRPSADRESSKGLYNPPKPDYHEGSHGTPHQLPFSHPNPDHKMPLKNSYGGAQGSASHSSKPDHARPPEDSYSVPHEPSLHPLQPGHSGPSEDSYGAPLGPPLLSHSLKPNYNEETFEHGYNALRPIIAKPDHKKPLDGGHSNPQGAATTVPSHLLLPGSHGTPQEVATTVSNRFPLPGPSVVANHLAAAVRPFKTSFAPPPTRKNKPSSTLVGFFEPASSDKNQVTSKPAVEEYSGNVDHVEAILNVPLYYSETKKIKFKQKDDGIPHDREAVKALGGFNGNADFSSHRVSKPGKANEGEGAKPTTAA